MILYYNMENVFAEKISACGREGSAPAAARGEGTIRFNGRWELIDQCFVSPGLAAKADFRICRIPFLTTRDSAHSGEKPLRTYQGPRYLGGVSDHYPILVHIRM